MPVTCPKGVHTPQMMPDCQQLNQATWPQGGQLLKEAESRGSKQIRNPADSGLFSSPSLTNGPSEDRYRKKGLLCDREQPPTLRRHTHTLQPDCFSNPLQGQVFKLSIALETNQPWGKPSVGPLAPLSVAPPKTSISSHRHI